MSVISWRRKQKLLTIEEIKTHPRTGRHCQTDVGDIFWWMTALKCLTFNCKELHSTYRVCRGYRLMKRDDYFWVNSDHFWSKHHFFEAAGAVVEISSSLWIINFNQVKLAQILGTPRSISLNGRFYPECGDLGIQISVQQKTTNFFFIIFGTHCMTMSVPNLN